MGNSISTQTSLKARLTVASTVAIGALAWGLLNKIEVLRLRRALRSQREMLRANVPPPMSKDSVFTMCAVGTENVCKLAAVQDVIKQFADNGSCLASNASVVPTKVPSGVAEQPLSLRETRDGARNRAKAAYERVRASVRQAEEGKLIGIGIESGLFHVEDEERYYDVCVSSVYDGEQFREGLSCAFEVPQKIMKFVLKNDMDLSQASNAAGVASNPFLGQAEGLIGKLSHGRINRQEYTRQAIAMSLMSADRENGSLYV